MNTVTDKKAIGFTAFGACLEWFEFTLYAFTAPYLSAVFFPHDNKMVGLIAVFGVFAAGYLMRPLGGIIIGHIGDKKGRNYALKLSILLMSLPMLVTALSPTYEQIGASAVVILIFARMIQGFSIGGEYTGVLVMLIEHAPKKHRGFVTSLATMSSSVGVLLSSMIVATLAYFFTYDQMVEWGWRVAFIIGFILAIISFYMQKSVAESPMYVKYRKEAGTKKEMFPLLQTWRYHKKELMYVFVLTGYLGIAYYIMAAYLPNSLITLRNLDESTVLWITTFFSAVYAITAPLWGYISDRLGRKIMIVIPTIILMLTAYPLFNIFTNGTFVLIMMAQGFLALLISAATCAFQVAINELFPTDTRYSGVSASYNISNALLGGTAPVIAALFVAQTGDELAPAYYLIIASFITLLLIFKMPETKDSKHFHH